MKNAILQIKKLDGTGKQFLPELKKVYFDDNKILWTDNYFYYQKELETDILSGYCTDLKNLYNVVKTIKKIESINVINDILILNDSYKIKVEKTNENDVKYLKSIFTNDLKNQNIINDFVISDFKEFIKSAEDKSYMSLLHNFIIKPDSMACTDGNRLNIIKAKTNVNDKNGVLLPAEFITKNNNKKSDFYISKDKKYISCISNNEIITHAYIDGQYPKYEQLIPHNETLKKYDNKELLQVLKNIKSLVNKRTNCIIFNFNKNQIEFDTDDNIKQNIDFNFNMPACTGFGVIGFNIQYLIELLQFHDNDLIFNYGNSELSAVLCKSGTDKTTILMPIMTEYRHVDFKPEIIESEAKTETAIKTIENVESIETVTESDMPAVETPEKTEKIVINENFEIEKPEEKTGIKSVLNKIKNKVKTAVNTVKMCNYTPLYEHKNAVTGHVYGGSNIMKLDKMMTQCGYETSLWLGNYQAKKLGKQVKSGAEAVMIRIFYENDDGTKFSKLETVYNVAELELLQKTEEKEEYKSVVNRFKKRA